MGDVVLSWLDSLWLDPVPSGTRDQTRRYFMKRDAAGFLMGTSNEHGLDLVERNRNALISIGIYETALIQAYIGMRTNNLHFTPARLRRLFAVADPKRLRAQGDPLPGTGPYTLYRGVAGNGAARRVRGMSWTADVERARWFAVRFGHLARPAIFTVEAPKRWVLFYSNEREEREFVIQLPDGAKPAKCWSATDGAPTKGGA